MSDTPNSDQHVSVAIDIRNIPDEYLGDVLAVLSKGALFYSYVGFRYIITRYASIISAMAHVLDVECVCWVGRVDIEPSYNYQPSQIELDNKFHQSSFLRYHLIDGMWVRNYKLPK